MKTITLKPVEYILATIFFVILWTLSIVFIGEYVEEKKKVEQLDNTGYFLCVGEVTAVTNYGIILCKVDGKTQEVRLFLGTAVPAVGETIELFRQGDAYFVSTIPSLGPTK